MILCNIVNWKGVVQEQKVPIEDESLVDYKTHIPIKEHPLPHRASLCKWSIKKKKWTVLSEAKKFDKLRLTAHKARKIAECKTVCSELIETVYPLYKQMNLLRENSKHDCFRIIDALRALSNDIEESIMEVAGLDELRLLDVRKCFQTDQRARDENGKFIGDNPDTPNVNEAFETGKITRS